MRGGLLRSVAAAVGAVACTASPTQTATSDFAGGSVMVECADLGGGWAYVTFESGMSTLEPLGDTSETSSDAVSEAQGRPHGADDAAYDRAHQIVLDATDLPKSVEQARGRGFDDPAAAVARQGEASRFIESRPSCLDEFTLR